MTTDDEKEQQAFQFPRGAQIGYLVFYALLLVWALALANRSTSCRALNFLAALLLTPLYIVAATISN